MPDILGETTRGSRPVEGRDEGSDVVCTIGGVVEHEGMLEDINI